MSRQYILIVAPFLLVCRNVDAASANDYVHNKYCEMVAIRDRRI
jgi:hypothetical protein